MPNATPAQVEEWGRFKKRWETTRSKFWRMLGVAEYAARMQVWCDQNGIPAQLFTQAEADKMKERSDKFNQIENAIFKVESGLYSLHFENNDISIVVPPGTEPETYLEDQVQGFSGPLLVIGIVGAIVVSALFGTSSLIDSISDSETQSLKNRIIDKVQEVAKLPDQVQALYTKFMETNQESAKQGGIWDSIKGFFGGAAGKVAGVAIAAGFFLLALAFARRK